MAFLQQPITVYEAVREPTAQTTIADVLLGVVAVVLGLAGTAIVLGLLYAVVLIAVRRARGSGGARSGGTDATRLGLDASSSSSLHPKR